ncbi:MAG: FAD-dependent oxidoreductase [Candidatus Helarchaeota archaeon]
MADEKSNHILIIGAGLAGMESALDLADTGYKVYLVENTQAIGGKYAQIYKIFPYDECAACIMTPKLNQIGKHPNIEIITLAEVVSVKGSIGNFKVTILKKPRYVDEEKCTGCGKCIETCPVEVEHEYNFGLSKRKAIYLDFAQQIPFVVTIDKDHCIECMMCVQRCKAEAIDHSMKEKEISLKVGAIIIATGFEEFDPSIKEEYGFKRYKNVITSLMYERMTHPAGLDNISRPSDGKKPKRVVFVNCVGARDESIGKKYCNKVCCMFSMKNARNLRMHEPDAEIFICYIDVRAAGKLFERYYRSTLEQYGIKFIRGRVSEILEDPKTNDLSVRLENTEVSDPIILENIDYVVLNCSFVPSDGTKKMAKLFNLEFGEDGFIKDLNSNIAPIETPTPGIYVIGTVHGPRDGTDVIAEAKAAASAATADLPPLTKQKEKKKDTTKKKEEKKIRVGVFVCHCGGIISHTVDVKAIVEQLKQDPNVEFVEDYIFMCSSPGQDLIKENIKKHNLNRIIVASCTPLVHEPTFRSCVESAGLSRFFFEGPINIREQCAMVHKDFPEIATQKALALIKGGIARVSRLDEVPVIQLDVRKSVLIIGGGVSGLSAGIDLAKRGLEVHIIEKDKKIGGRLNKLYKLFPHGADAKAVLNQIIEKINTYNNIKIHTSSRIIDFSGRIGDYKVILDKGGKKLELNVGSIIVSIGTKVYTPEIGDYCFGQTEKVITSLELEDMLKNDSLKEPKSVVFIQCVGSRAYSGEKGHVHCSRVCCNSAIKNAEIIKEKFPSTDIYILYKEFLRAYGRFMEEKYIDTQMKGVNFLRWIRERPPKVKVDIDSKKLIVNVYDSLLQAEVNISADYIVLSVGQDAPEGLDNLCNILGITKSIDGFVEEMHLKFRPVETKVPGIYSSSSFPKDIADSISLARGAASKVAIQLKGIELELTTAEVDENICIGCGLCEAICPYEAIKMVEMKPGKIISVTDEFKCQGCGTCVASCPIGARDHRWWRDAQYLAQIDAILNEK